MKSALRNVLQSLLDLLVRFKRTRDVLFVVHNEIMFQCAHEIFLAVRDVPRVRFWFCFVSPALTHDLPGLRDRYRIRTISHRLAKRIRWDLIVFPDHIGSFRLGCPKIYSGHGIESGKLVKGTSYVFGPRSRDGDGGMIYRKIFCSSAFVQEQVRTACPEFSPHVRVVGNLLADRLWGQVPDREALLKSMDLDPARRTIFICSTWGPDSLIQCEGGAVVREINKLGGRFNIIVSLHLMNYLGLDTDRVDARQLMAEVMARHFHLARPDEDGGLFLLPLADVLVTDSTSLGLFFPHYERPIIFYDVPRLGFAPVGLVPELKKAAYVIDRFADMEAHVDRCLAEFRLETMRELSRKIVSFEGRAAERHREEILESLGFSGRPE